MSLAMLAALLPSMMFLLPAAHAQPMEMGEHCNMVGHIHGSGQGDPDRFHECHCLLCLVQAIDVGLPTSIILWRLPGHAPVAVIQFPYQPYTSTTWLVAEPRGPPVHS
ncbi:MAG: DUF2946 family protein [Pseudomonas gingeri]